MSIREHKHIVFGHEHYNPLGVVRSLGESGLRPILIIKKAERRITSLSKYAGKIHFVDSLDEGLELLINEYGYEANKPFIYTADDKTAYLFDCNYDRLKNHFIFFNAGKQGRLSFFMNKKNLCDLAEKHCVPIAKTWVVKKGEVPQDLIFPIVTKALISTVQNWKSESFVCKNIGELEKAYSEINSDQVILQQYIEKKNELCLDGFCIDGGKKTYIAIASNYNYVLPNNYSPYMTVHNFDDYDLFRKISEMFSEVGFEGIFSIEFLVGKNEELYFLEINFRNSTWSYASTYANMPLPVMWSEGMINGYIKDGVIKKISKPFCAMDEFGDFSYRVKHGNTSVLTWLKDFLRCECKYLYNSKDIKPFLGVVKSIVFKG